MDKNKETWDSTHKHLKSHLISIKVQIRNLREDGRVEGKEPILDPKIAGPLKAYVRFVLPICISIAVLTSSIVNFRTCMTRSRKFNQGSNLYG
jgi:hypothetical protein